jgi:hypothetical protein
MTSTPRRRVLRPLRSPTVDPRLQARRQKRCEQLARERASLARWMARLRRAFHAVEKQQARISRLEKQLANGQAG